MLKQNPQLLCQLFQDQRFMECLSVALNIARPRPHHTHSPPHPITPPSPHSPPQDMAGKGDAAEEHGHAHDSGEQHGHSHGGAECGHSHDDAHAHPAPAQESKMDTTPDEPVNQQKACDCGMCEMID